MTAHTDKALTVEQVAEHANAVAALGNQAASIAAQLERNKMGNEAARWWDEARKLFAEAAALKKRELPK